MGQRQPNARFVPDNPGDYADFAVATAKRYPSVRLWSVWGEPNRESMFGPLTPSRVKGPLNAAQQVAPHNYALLLDTTYGALKALNPANLIIGGNTFNSTGTRLIHPYQWIKYLTLPNGSRPRMDLYGHNPFCYRKPTLHAPPSPMGRVDFSDLPRFGKAIDRYFPGPSCVSSSPSGASTSAPRSKDGSASTSRPRRSGSAPGIGSPGTGIASTRSVGSARSTPTSARGA